MNFFTFALLLLYVTYAQELTVGDDADVDSECLTVKVKGQSGKISLMSKCGEEGKAEVTIEMDAITEVDKDGNEVGKSGKVKHSLNSFATTDFEFDTELQSTKLGDADAKFLQFKTTVATVGKITVTMYIISDGGEYKLDDETYVLKEDDFKFNIAIDDWPFCEAAVTDQESNNYCSDGVDGTHLDFKIKIKGKDGDQAKKKEKSNEEDTVQSFELGEGVEASFSGKMKNGDEIVDMGENNPSTTQDGGKMVFNFRFPKGSKLWYDPVLSGFGESDMNSASTCQLAPVFLLATILVALNMQ